VIRVSYLKVAERREQGPSQIHHRTVSLSSFPSSSSASTTWLLKSTRAAVAANISASAGPVAVSLPLPRQ
jgi:hypothetical protein